MRTVEISLTGKRVVELYDVFECLCRDGGRAFQGFAASHNLDEIRQLRDAIITAGRPAARVLLFDQRRVELCRKHAVRDADGEPVEAAGETQLNSETRAAFDAAFIALKELFAADLHGYAVQRSELAAIMAREFPFQLLTFHETDIQSASLTPARIATLTGLVDPA